MTTPAKEALKFFKKYQTSNGEQLRDATFKILTTCDGVPIFVECQTYVMGWINNNYEPEDVKALIYEALNGSEDYKAYTLEGIEQLIDFISDLK